MFWIMLAQEGAPKPDEAIGWAERMSKGGVPVICLTVAIAAVVGLVIVFKMLLNKSDKFTDLEKTYRENIENDRKQDKIDYENRLKAAEAAADKREQEKMAMMKERLQAEKESDATLAQAIHVIEADTKLADKVDKKLDVIDDLKRQVADMADRLRRLEDQRRPA